MMRIIFYLLIVIGASACVKDYTFYEGTDIQLTFSTDTLRFDTVFTTQGSSTRSIKVFNPKDEAIRIGEVRFVGNNQRFFRMNVDGVSGEVFKNVVILPRDSIYIFVEVTIDPDQPTSVSPFVIEEGLLFQTNGQQQVLPLEAWGQNANYVPNNTNSGGVALLTCNNGTVTWDDPRPYVIFGALVVDSCVLNVLAGTRIHIHGGVVQGGNGFYTDGIIFTLPDGRLQFEGTYEDPIIIRTDRLESNFEKLPGQWGGIRLGPNSRGHRLEHVKIYNPIVGVLVDSNANVILKNVEIGYTTGSGISSFNGDVEADNVLIHSTSQYGVQILLGGTHRYRHCTISNFGNTADALFAANRYCLDPICETFYEKSLDLEFTNSILVGNGRDEILLSAGAQNPAIDFNFRFDHCLVKVDEILDVDQWPDFLNDCINCLEFKQGDRLFKDLNNQDFHLDSLSIVKGKGLFIPELNRDLDGNPRIPGLTSMGCYEYFE
jgi:hypothetical protein